MTHSLGIMGMICCVLSPSTSDPHCCPPQLGCHRSGLSPENSWPFGWFSRLGHGKAGARVGELGTQVCNCPAPFSALFHSTAAHSRPLPQRRRRCRFLLTKDRAWVNESKCLPRRRMLCDCGLGRTCLSGLRWLFYVQQPLVFPFLSGSGGVCAPVSE